MSDKDLRNQLEGLFSDLEEPIRAEEGRPAFLEDAVEDITEHKRAEEALVEERNLLQALIDNVPDRIYAKDTESRFIVCNKALVHRMRVNSLDDVVGKTDFDFVPPELAAQFRADEEMVMRTGQPLINREEPIDSPDGRLRWNLATKVPLRDSQGKIIGIVGIGREITEIKLAELALERRALQLQTAAEVSHTASSVLDPDELIQQVVDLVRERFDLYYAGLFLVDQTGEWTDEPGKWAVLRAGTGEAGQKMLEQGHKLQIGGTSMIGWCVANKRARIALDVGEEAVRFANPLLPETRSELALPLVSRGEAIGALTVQSTEEAAFSDEDIAVLQTMADQLANAIANARLFEQTQHASFLMRLRVKELACLNDIGRKMDETPPVPEFLQWVAARIPLAMRYPDMCLAAIEFEGQVYGAAEAVSLPRQMVQALRIGSEVIGRIHIAYIEEHDFLDEESALLGDIVRRVSGYTENRRLFEQTQKALKEIEATHRLYLREQWAEFVPTRAAPSYERTQPGVTPLGDVVLPEVEQAMAQREVVVQSDTGHGAGQAALVAPISLRGEVIGALGLHETENKRRWTDDEVALIEAVADQMALAIENARLFEQTQRHATYERLLAEITARVRSSMDPQTILQTAVRELGAALGTDRAFVQIGMDTPAQSVTPEAKGQEANSEKQEPNEQPWTLG